MAPGPIQLRWRKSSPLSRYEPPYCMLVVYFAGLEEELVVTLFSTNNSMQKYELMMAPNPVQMKLGKSPPPSINEPPCRMLVVYFVGPRGRFGGWLSRRPKGTNGITSDRKRKSGFCFTR